MLYGYKIENKKNSYLFVYKQNVYKTKTALKKELQKQKISATVIDILMENVIYCDKDRMYAKLAEIGLLKNDIDKAIDGVKS